MCGILLHAVLHENSEGEGHDCVRPKWWQSGVEVISKRGPDACSDNVHEFDKGRLMICASVLGLRGQDVVEQPIKSADGQLLLLWNGEVFESTLEGFDLAKHDGAQLFHQIEQELSRWQFAEERCAAFANVLDQAEGPYATVLVDFKTTSIYFARDPIGRRSLLIGIETDALTLTSATNREMMTGSMKEVDCSYVWRVRLSDMALTRIPRQRKAPVSLPRSVPAEDKVATLERFRQILSESVRVRVRYLRAETDVAILFSGGLDCSTLALLVHQHLPDHRGIDLLNVAFENPRVLASAKQGQGTYNVPDRQTGKASLLELERVAPTRSWRLVEINVPYDEYLRHRSTIEDLMSPCTSVMDLSIAAALYFAARAQGRDGQSTARVLVSGLGADELLGGYSRHRKAFQHHGMRGLEEELEMDLDRLPERNLGRDDRIISSSGKECRYPFLDANVVGFLSQLSAQEKMNLDYAPGTGDKMLLRMLARQLGLEQISTLSKRAIQFGARSAKMDVGGGRVKGHESLQASR